MDAVTPRPADAPQPIEFSGSAGSFFGLAFGNLLLTIITIGIYRFWAKTRVRAYLWERTSFQGEPLEYRGRGIEKLLGALVVLGAVFVPLAIVGMIIAALGSAGDKLLAMLLYLPVYIGLIYLLGVGIYRSQRYIFSRTSWRGIRGGMTSGGWGYGVLYLKMTLLQVVSLGFATPYVTTRVWNARMNDGMFGSLPVAANAEWRPLFRRFIMVWVVALAVYAGIAATVMFGMPDVVAMLKAGSGRPADPEAAKATLAALGRLYGLIFLGGIVIALLMMGYYAAMLRELFGKTRIGTMALSLDVTPLGLIGFYLGNIAIVVFTLGLGVIIMPYRSFGFYARRLSTIGAFDADKLLQTSLAGPVQGDGLADAFDISAF